MSQNPNQAPQPQWDPQRGQWYIPDSQQSQFGPPGQGGRGMPSPTGNRYDQQPYGVPGHVPPPPPPPKKTTKWPWIVGAAVLLVLIISISTSGGGTSTPTASSGASPAASSSAAAPAAAAETTATSAAATGVVYTVSGSGKANNISYGEATKGISQANGERLPWTKSTAATEGFAIYSLVAQNNGSGEITCSITVDGKEIATNTSSGQYAVVTCTGNTSPF